MEEEENVYTTGDFYLDNYLQDEAEQEQVYQQPEEDNFYEDDRESLDYLNNVLISVLDEDTYDDVISNYGTPGIKRIGTKVFSDVHSEIASLESGGRYDALPYKKDGTLASSAVGKYQFLWDTWGKEIMRTTGVKSKEEFRQTPEAQDYYYNEVYVPNHVLPWVSKTKRELRSNIPDDQLIKLYHFRGAAGARQYLKGQLPDVTDDFNAPISRYTGIQAGQRYMQVAGDNSKNMNYKPLAPLPPNIQVSTPTLKSKYEQEIQATAPTGTAGNYTPSETQKKADGVKIAEALANIGEAALGAGRTFKDIKGRGLSTVTSVGSALASSQLQREREQLEIQRMYENLQSDFNDTLLESPGKLKNIWE